MGSRYTNVMLTIVAVALSILAAEGAFALWTRSGVVQVSVEAEEPLRVACALDIRDAGTLDVGGILTVETDIEDELDDIGSAMRWID